MDINAEVQNTLAVKIANLSLEAAQYQALYKKEVSEHEETKNELNSFKEVLESDSSLKELFNEIKGEMK